jgi:hypothetical protein
MKKYYKEWCIEKLICIFNNILQKDFIPKILYMKKWKWPQKGLQSLSPSSLLAHLIVITPLCLCAIAPSCKKLSSIWLTWIFLTIMFLKEHLVAFSVMQMKLWWITHVFVGNKFYKQYCFFILYVSPTQFDVIES